MIFSEKVGDYFGEVALLYDRPRAANVIADGKMKALVRWRASPLCSRHSAPANLKPGSVHLPSHLGSQFARGRLPGFT